MTCGTALRKARMADEYCDVVPLTLEGTCKSRPEAGDPCGGPTPEHDLIQRAREGDQAAFAELISRRVDGACARRLMRAALAEAPFGLLEQPDVLDKMGDARRALVEYSATPGAAGA